MFAGKGLEIFSSLPLEFNFGKNFLKGKLDCKVDSG